MMIVDLEGIRRTDGGGLHYRRTYDATAVVAIPSSDSARKRVRFTVEHQALGPVDVSVSLLDSIDYPLLPALKSLKEHIVSLENRGRLP